MASHEAGPAQYYFNTRTRMVEKGRVSSWEDLMGPYDTEAQARDALAKAAQRVDDWDQEDDEWRDDS